MIQRILVSIILMCLTLIPTGALGRPQRRVLPNQLLKIFFAELCSNGCSDEAKTRWRENLRWKFHDLNKDSTPEYFLYIDHADWCGAGGSNCTYWIYQRISGGYKLLLDAPMARPLKRMTNSYRDIYSDFRLGAAYPQRKFEYSRKFYKYDGQKYREHSEKVIYKNG
jgi:hypothetical protein